MTVPFDALWKRTGEGEGLTLTFVDLSQVLSPGEVTYPLDPPFCVLPWCVYEVHGVATRALFLSEHAGTHVDVPLHFFPGGEGIEEVPLERFCGWIRVFGEEGSFALENLRASPPKEGEIVLLAGDTSLREEDARFLVECRIKGIGVEKASIDNPPFPLHRLFLEKGILIYENLRNVKDLIGKRALFLGFPLKILSGTASPVRAVAVIFSRKDANVPA